MDKFYKYWLLLCVVCFTQPIMAQVLIVNPNNTELALSRSSIRSIFAMRTHQWSNGTPIQVFVLEDTDTLHISFCKDILGMFPYQLRRLWDKQVFSGTGIAPITVKSVKEMRDRVAAIEGAIGYLEAEQINDSVKQIGKLR